MEREDKEKSKRHHVKIFLGVFAGKYRNLPAPQHPKSNGQSAEATAYDPPVHDNRAFAIERFLPTLRDIPRSLPSGSADLDCERLTNAIHSHLRQFLRHEMAMIGSI